MSKKDEITSAGLPVSVVIVNYNAGAILIECIRAVMPQATEILVVDNASSDLSIESCRQQFADAPRLRILCNDSNLGFAVACNIGFAETTENSVLFLNPDCRLNAGAVAELLQVLHAYPTTGMVGGLLVDLAGTEQRGGRRAVPTPWRSFVRAFGLNRFANRWPKLFVDFHLHKEPLPDHPIEVEAISGACMLVKREAVAAVGLWDEGYFLHCEDLDWCMRFRQRGWKILFVPSVRVTHIQGVCSRRRPILVEWHKHRGMLRFYRKFFRHQYPGILMGLVALGVWMRFGMRVGYHLGRRIFGWKSHADD
ncbi:MAG: glycosyltransferase family 2 protein [Desulfobulbaceae bacterium]|nr:glycosyltransferase family 2 protein [Desulfobulbaceae bacterium]